MRFRRPVIGALASVALACSTLSAATATASASSAPCGFYKTSADAFYNHCTGDGSNVVIKVRVAWSRDYEECVPPGRTWLGSAKSIQNAYYTGRTC